MPKRKGTTSQQEHSASKEQAETTGIERDYERIFDVATGEPVELTPSHEHLEAEGEIDDSITSCLRDLALTGTEHGVLIVTGVWSFPGESFHPKLIAIARKGIPEAVKDAILSKTSSFWELPTRDFGFCRLEIKFKPAHDEVVIATVAAEKQLGEGLPETHGPRKDPRDAARILMEIAARIDSLREQAKEEVQKNLKDYLLGQDMLTAEAKKKTIAWIKDYLSRNGYVLEYKDRQCRLHVNIGQRDRKGQFRVIPMGGRSSDCIIKSDNIGEILEFINVAIAFHPQEPAPSYWQTIVETSAKSPARGKGRQ